LNATAKTGSGRAHGNLTTNKSAHRFSLSSQTATPPHLRSPAERAKENGAAYWRRGALVALFLLLTFCSVFTGVKCVVYDFPSDGGGAENRCGKRVSNQLSACVCPEPVLVTGSFFTRLKRISASINGSRFAFAFVSPHRMAPLLALSIGLTNLEFWISKRLVASHAKAIGTKSLSLSLAFPL